MRAVEQDEGVAREQRHVFSAVGGYCMNASTTGEASDFRWRAMEDIGVLGQVMVREQGAAGAGIEDEKPGGVSTCDLAFREDGLSSKLDEQGVVGEPERGA